MSGIRLGGLGPAAPLHRGSERQPHLPLCAWLHSHTSLQSCSVVNSDTNPRDITQSVPFNVAFSRWSCAVCCLRAAICLSRCRNCFLSLCSPEARDSCDTYVTLSCSTCHNNPHTSRDTRSFFSWAHLANTCFNSFSWFKACSRCVFLA